MSVQNFDGDGFSDQPSVIYGFSDTASTDGMPNSIQDILSYTETHHDTDDDDDIHIRELCRSGFAAPGPSPGDVIPRESTKSTLDTRLPELDLPGRGGMKYDTCGDAIPAFACLGHDDDPESQGCGKPVFIGQSCASPSCERDWAAGIKRNVVRQAGMLDALSRILRHRTGEAIDQNHVVASLPSIVFDSDNPLKRALLVIKTILEETWGIKGFLAIYHPYRIKKEYRADQYSHGGAEGEGDMTWSDVLSSENPMQYLKFEPHFHLFFPAKRKQFDYSVVPGVYKDSGWVFHRITKGGDDCNVSVGRVDNNGNPVDDDSAVLNDLVHQLTYCYSHAGVYNTGERDKLASRLKGDLATEVDYVQDDVEDQALAAFCEAAPKLLGVRFTNVNNSTCDAEIGSGCDDDEYRDQIEQLYRTTGNGSDSWPDDTFDLPAGTSANSGSTNASTSTTKVAVSSDGSSEPSEDGVASPVVDDREPCGGTIKPISEAESRLDDPEWCAQAEYHASLRQAVEIWKNMDSDKQYPWLTDEDEGDDIVAPEVQYPPD